MHKILIGQFDYLVKEVRIHYKKKSAESNDNYFNDLVHDIEPVQDNENIEKLFHRLNLINDNSLTKKEFLARAAHFFYIRKVLFSQKESYVYLTNTISRNDILLYNNQTLFIESNYNDVIHCIDENNKEYSFIKEKDELYIVIGKFARSKITTEELSHELARRKFWSNSMLALSQHSGFKKELMDKNLIVADELLKFYDERFKPFH